MIFFVAPVETAFTMPDYLQREDSRHLAGRIRVLTYDEVFSAGALPLGSYVFSGLDQLTPTGNDLIARGRNALTDAASGLTLLNDPARVVHRYELLRSAFEGGRNSFRVARASTLPGGLRFPVFVRSEREHTGSLTGLIHSAWQLYRELAAACIRGYRLQDLLVVEYCETVDAEGIYRKYSAFVVGDQVIPRSVTQSSAWVTKEEGRIINEEVAREELNYVTSNPHATWLRETFHLAGTEYGRVDYGLLDGKPQLWEVNLNPTMSRHFGKNPRSHRTEAQRKVLATARAHHTRLFQAALLGLDVDFDPARMVSLSISAPERAKLEAEQRAFEDVRSRRTVLARVLHPPARFMKRALGF
jgi:hypothetical protein